MGHYPNFDLELDATIHSMHRHLRTEMVQQRLRVVLYHEDLRKDLLLPSGIRVSSGDAVEAVHDSDSLREVGEDGLDCLLDDPDRSHRAGLKVVTGVEDVADEGVDGVGLGGELRGDGGLVHGILLRQHAYDM